MVTENNIDDQQETVNKAKGMKKIRNTATVPNNCTRAAE